MEPPPSKLPGPAVERLHVVLANAFPTRSALARMVRVGLDENLETIAAPGNLSSAIFDLIEWAEARGRLGDLISGARSANPEAPALRALSEDPARWLDKDMAQSLPDKAPVSTSCSANYDTKPTDALPEEGPDVLIVTAVKEEWDAVLAVETGTHAGSGWHRRLDSTGPEVAFRTYATESGVDLRVAVVQAFGMGREQAVIAAAPLLERYAQIRCLAMCGVCAGRRGNVALGDVVIADRAWPYDAGKVQETVDEQGQRVMRFQGDMDLYRIHPPEWKQKAERFQPDPSAEWLGQRPRSYEEQGDWILERLAKNENPAMHADRNTRCPDWGPVLKGLWKAKRLREGELSLTDNGRVHIHRRILLEPDGLQEPGPFKVVVGPIASGAPVVEDSTIFERLSDTASMRKVVAVEMETSAILALAYLKRVPFVIVMKGVMDHADAFKSDNMKLFAARASAECLLAFLRQNLSARNESCGTTQGQHYALPTPNTRPPGTARAAFERARNEMRTTLTQLNGDDASDVTAVPISGIILPPPQDGEGSDPHVAKMVEMLGAAAALLPKVIIGPNFRFKVHSNVAKMIVRHIRSGDSLMILGPAGSGKSTLLRIALVEILKSHSLMGLAMQHVVVYARARRVASVNSVESLLQTLAEDFSRFLPTEFFWQALDDGRLVVGIDGLDETINSSEFAGVLHRLIEKFGHRVRLVVSCRFEVAPLIGSSRRVLIAPLSDRAIHTFLGKRLVGCTPKQRAAIFGQFAKDSRIASSLRTPQMLSFLCRNAQSRDGRVYYSSFRLLKEFTERAVPSSDARATFSVHAYLDIVQVETHRPQPVEEMTDHFIASGKRVGILAQDATCSNVLFQHEKIRDFLASRHLIENPSLFAGVPANKQWSLAIFLAESGIDYVIRRKLMLVEEHSPLDNIRTLVAVRQDLTESIALISEIEAKIEQIMSNLMKGSESGDGGDEDHVTRVQALSICANNPALLRSTWLFSVIRQGPGWERFHLVPLLKLCSPTEPGIAATARAMLVEDFSEGRLGREFRNLLRVSLWSRKAANLVVLILACGLAALNALVAYGVGHAGVALGAASSGIESSTRSFRFYVFTAVVLFFCFRFVRRLTLAEAIVVALSVTSALSLVFERGEFLSALGILFFSGPLAYGIVVLSEMATSWCLKRACRISGLRLRAPVSKKLSDKEFSFIVFSIGGLFVWLGIAFFTDEYLILDNDPSPAGGILHDFLTIRFALWSLGSLFVHSTISLRSKGRAAFHIQHLLRTLFAALAYSIFSYFLFLFVSGSGDLLLLMTPSLAAVLTLVMGVLTGALVSAGVLQTRLHRILIKSINVENWGTRILCLSASEQSAVFRGVSSETIGASSSEFLELLQSVKDTVQKGALSSYRERLRQTTDACHAQEKFL